MCNNSFVLKSAAKVRTFHLPRNPFDEGYIYHKCGRKAFSTRYGFFICVECLYCFSRIFRMIFQRNSVFLVDFSKRRNFAADKTKDFINMAERQIILADNQDITRLGLKTLIRGALKDVDGLAVKELSRRAELIAELKENPSSVVVIDYTKFDLASSDELLNLSERFPFAMWVFFSDDLTEQLIRRLSVEQQFSMILKDDSAQEIITALKCAITGVRFLCHQVTNLLLTPSAQQSLAERDQLTATEKEVLRQIALGKSVKEVAVERNSSIHTITTHKKNIFRKINVNTVFEATKYALRAGLVEMVEYYI